MKKIELDPLYIIKNYKEIDLVRDNSLLDVLKNKCIIFLFFLEREINIDLFKIKNNSTDFLEISPWENKIEKYYTISFRKNFDMNKLFSGYTKINKKYYIPSENWKVEEILINREIDKIIFSYLGYYIPR
tara:strand:- start:760 stop:1149 length:390 start_codon:yes stop_codon:yes gene_type:complete